MIDYFYGTSLAEHLEGVEDVLESFAKMFAPMIDDKHQTLSRFASRFLAPPDFSSF